MRNRCGQRPDGFMQHFQRFEHVVREGVEGDEYAASKCQLRNGEYCCVPFFPGTTSLAFTCKARPSADRTSQLFSDGGARVPS